VPLEAVRTVSADDAGVRIVDIKHCVGVVKVPGGESNASRGLSGVVLNKDTAHPQTHRRVLKPRMVLLDCSLEYKNGETKVEVSKETDCARADQIWEEQVDVMVGC
jgi:T-complex protein 1 subunit gamma